MKVFLVVDPNRDNEVCAAYAEEERAENNRDSEGKRRGLPMFSFQTSDRAPLKIEAHQVY